MKNTIMKVSVLVAALATFGSSFAGTLDPPGPPAPTMVTLQQIYDKIGAGAVGVPKTGATACWDASGSPISCAGTGQDGELQRGVSISPRFTDNSNGTVRDNLTGLIWLKNASCFGEQTWPNALALSNTLASGTCGLTDGSAAGAWRLANIKELQSLIDWGHLSPALPAGHPFTGVSILWYWSSTTQPDNPGAAWRVFLNYGFIEGDYKSNVAYTWPVRGGQ